VKDKSKIVIVGSGPAGLFCAYLLLKRGYQVDVYDQSSGPAKKFLIAGNGGLNLTHSEDLDSFASKYQQNEAFFSELLRDFSPNDLRNWCSELDVETFIGSSGRVFPKEMSAGKVVVKWLNKLKEHDTFSLKLKHKLIKVSKDKKLTFSNEYGDVTVSGDVIIFSLGGSSWKKTGSDGLWKNSLEELGVEVAEFLPMNCGFERTWSPFFKEHNDRSFLKHVEISFESVKAKGDLMLTSYGVEGGVVYAISREIRDSILKEGRASISIDLRPALSEEEILKRLNSKKKKISLSNHLRKVLNFDQTLFILLKELLSAEELASPSKLAAKIKKLDMDLYSTREIDEAISTSGGVTFPQLNSNLEHRELRGLFFCGEMLDYDAPTGGYLLQACFSTASRVAKGIMSTY
jgi:uncharacterized flavoprotein (TIGR03862 family)